METKSATKNRQQATFVSSINGPLMWENLSGFATMYGSTKSTQFQRLAVILKMYLQQGKLLYFQEGEQQRRWSACTYICAGWSASLLFAYNKIRFSCHKAHMRAKEVHLFYLFNPLYTNGFFLLVWYNKLGIAHCTYLGVSGVTNSVDPYEMPHKAAFHLGLHCL